MKKINILKLFSCLVIFLLPLHKLSAETIILSSCDNKKDGFLKNEYTDNEILMCSIYRIKSNINFERLKKKYLK